MKYRPGVVTDPKDRNQRPQGISTMLQKGRMMNGAAASRTRLLGRIELRRDMGTSATGQVARQCLTDRGPLVHQSA